MNGFFNGTKDDQTVNTTSTFTFPATDAPLHIVDQNGEPWFIAKDVCDVLGIDTSNLTKTLDLDEMSTCPVQYTDQVRTVVIINESGLYSLILRSRKSQAKQFKKWITSVVLPAIRKDGGYILGEERMNILASELEEAQLILEGMEILKRKADRLAQENSTLLPKAALFDQYLNTEGTLTLTESGKIMGISGRSLGLLLRRNHWLFKSKKGVIPTQYALNKGWMIAVPIDGPSIDGKPNCYGRITKRGLEVLMEIRMEEAV